ncbi:MAG: proton-conducting transporter membrane subunit [Bdellovibrionota bacterium]|nr:proton-conducting transporter membrane subunit [Bdellovibrionota bacterium]
MKASRQVGPNHFAESKFLLAPSFIFLGLALWCSFSSPIINFDFAAFSGGAHWGFQVDALSGLIASTVSFIGFAVLQFSNRYLEDDPKKKTFKRNILFTVLGVLGFILATNFLQMVISLAASSFFLNKLLRHFEERDGARKAASSRLKLSLLANGLLLSAAATLYSISGTLELNSLFLSLQNNAFVEANSLSITIATLLIGIAAFIKCAQYPFHSWLPQSMEAPTPVSALMHAGILNAGGYLLVRMSPLMVTAPKLSLLLAVLAAFSTLWAAIVMLTQTSVKKNMAYSTVAQMGFMLLQCALGAYQVAVVHIVGHAFYKAYSFLSSGETTDFAKLTRYFPMAYKDSAPGKTILTLLLSTTVIMSPYLLFGGDFYGDMNKVFLLIVLSIAVAQIMLNSQSVAQSLSLGAKIVTLYIALTVGMEKFLASSQVGLMKFGQQELILIISIISISFFLLYFFQNNLSRINETKLGKKLYVKSLKGKLV